MMQDVKTELKQRSARRTGQGAHQESSLELSVCWARHDTLEERSYERSAGALRQITLERQSGIHFRVTGWKHLMAALSLAHFINWLRRLCGGE